MNKRLCLYIIDIAMFQMYTKLPNICIIKIVYSYELMQVILR